ncbi:Protein kinase family protein [Rhynchospora pubera]|uniref:Protein kinase family protein n=1 Tax=Rhynchospora pubera TaxID=906938 RepID=A0AAV8DGN7_9POAL|nr:Protein kinase family protein [Rhynchospora pubera]
MERWRYQLIFPLLWLLVACQQVELCASVNGEGRMLLRLKEMVQLDLSDWDEASVDPCSWSRVECSVDGKVVALHLNDLGNKGTLYTDIETFLTDLNSADGMIRRHVLQFDEDPLSVSQAKKTRPKITLLQTPIPSPSPSPSPSLSPSPSPSLAPSPSTDPSPSQPLSPSPSSTPSQPLSKSPSHHNSISKVGTSSVQGRRHTHSLLLYVLVGVAISVGLAAISGSGYLLFARFRKFGVINPWATGLSGHLKNAFVTGVPSLNRSELQAACEDFSNILGTLPGRVLYKGTLSNGSEITVVSTMETAAAEWSGQLQSHFRNKISVLSEFSHKNFMNLVGYCEEEEPFTRMMVFEYTPNGTLFEHLHIKEAEQLDWMSRLRIAAGVIYCLDYMHCFSPPVTLKTLNSLSVYLTEDYAAKVADTNLHLEEKDSDCESDFDCSDEESSVYKFGVLLLEIISGRLPFSKDDGLLVLWASSYLKGKRPIMAMVDPTLKEVPETHVLALCEVIKSCIKPEITERPGIAEVATRMMSITGISPEAAAPRKSPLWWAELEVNSFEI